ncbi:MAG: A24 family peptidase [Bryobacteraceae bacterium]
MTLTVPPLGIEIVLLAVLLVAAVYDVRFRRIPNWITVTGVALGLLLNAFLSGPPGAWFSFAGVWFSLRGLGLAFGVYFLLHVIRAMGAGDVKLMAAVGALVGWQDWLGIFLITAVLGGVMGLILIASHGRVRKTLGNVVFILTEMISGRPAYIKKEELDVRNPKAMGLPHGAVIGVGTVFFLVVATHFAR